VKGIQQDYLVNEHRSVRRLKDYLRHLTAHFGDVRVNTITTDSIKTYIQKRQSHAAANGTINRELSCLKRMFRLAAQNTPPKVAQVPHIPLLQEHNVRSGFFTHEEFLAVRGTLPDHAQVAVTIAYYTGMRIGEILGLKWSQVDLVEGKISLTPLQTKTETPRIVYLVPDLNRVLVEAKRRIDAQYSACSWVCQRDGKPVREIKKSWRRACQRVGLEGRLIHDFRRTAVRNMSVRGCRRSSQWLFQAIGPEASSIDITSSMKPI
jgi:integrase